MRKRLLVSLLVLSVSSVSASEFMEFGAKDFKSTKLKESKWVFDIGANYMAYPTTLPAFEGAHHSIKNQEDYEVLGVGLGFGGEIYMGAGISSTIKIGGFYSKTTDTSIGQAAKDVDLELANTSNDHMVYGGEASASLNYLFETKSYGIQPFVEFALGAGQANIEKTYEYKGLEGGTSPDPEYYNIKMEEGFNYARSTIGLNVISSTGLLFYTKASRLGMVVNERSFKGKVETAAKTTTNYDGKKEKNLNESTEVMMYSLGMGFLF